MATTAETLVLARALFYGPQPWCESSGAATLMGAMEGLGPVEQAQVLEYGCGLLDQLGHPDARVWWVSAALRRAHAAVQTDDVAAWDKALELLGALLTWAGCEPRVVWALGDGEAPRVLVEGDGDARWRVRLSSEGGMFRWSRPSKLVRPEGFARAWRPRSGDGWGRMVARLAGEILGYRWHAERPEGFVHTFHLERIVDAWRAAVASAPPSPAAGADEGEAASVERAGS